MKPCENEKDQNLRSVNPWLGPCSSSFSLSIFACAGDMCVNCCLQTSKGRPMWVSSEFMACRPTSLHVCMRVATYGECIIASYRDQCRSIENRNSSAY